MPPPPGGVAGAAVHALARLGTAERRCLRDALYEEDAAAAGEAVGLLTGCGTPHAVLAESRRTIDQARSPLERLLPAPQQKAMLHALGWYAAQRIPDEAPDSMSRAPRMVLAAAAQCNGGARVRLGVVVRRA
ncbi:hypothetical protein OG195_03655 [Streptomyces sp. NBC_01362]|uniref:hypothetical protein n=2 Tax=Streptomyces TaxID=1883 RepID=UPI002E352582|nr:hypothetical protein [Streptomyces sp. NBC_01362]